MRPVLENVAEKAGQASLRLLRVPLVAKMPFWHSHPEIELTYMIEGRARRQVGDHVGTVRAGELMVLGADLPHDFNPVDRSIPCDFVVVQFLPDLFDRFGEFTGMQSLFAAARRGLVTRNLPVGVHETLMAMESASGSRRIIMLLDVLEQLMELADSHWTRLSSREMVVSGQQAMAQARLQKLLAFIDGAYGRPVSLGEVSDLVAMTPQSFCRWFRQMMGCNFVSYLNRIRIEEACRLLATSERQITDIAQRCGFESFSNFNRQFQRQHAMSPRDWRRENGLAVR